MCTSRMIKVALVLYTQGLDYDDRIRKEILSIQSLNPNISFKIFAVVPKNQEEEGMTSYGVPYKTLFLKSREKYPKASHALAKTWEFYKILKKDLKAFDAVWCADPETFLFVLMLRKKPLVWDLHELPIPFMGNRLLMMLFRQAEKKVCAMIHANDSRLKHLESLGMIRHPERQFILRNYPDFNEIDSEYDDLYHKFDNWLAGDKCVYLQGVNMKKRADRESIEAVLAVPGLKAVIIGNTRPDLRGELLERHSEKELEERLFFTGRIKQLKTPQYIRKCFISLVFYKNTSANNWYCEPNRLFQNIINGNPVVVGNNPPMKEFVERYGYGVSVETDGTDVEIIIDGLKELLSNYLKYKDNVEKKKEMLLWKHQEDEIQKIISKLI